MQKHKSTTKVWRVRTLEKGTSKNFQHFFIKKSSSKEKHETQQLIKCPNSLPKKYRFQQEGNHNFPGQTLCQNKYGIQKKYGFQKKKELILFFRAKHFAKKQEWDPKFSMGFKKIGTHTFGYFLAVLFFAFELKSISNRIKYRQKPFFQVIVFCLKLFSVQTEKKYRQKVPKSMSSFFFSSSFFFLDPILVFDNVWPEKVSLPFLWNLYYFSWVPYLFLAQCLARKKYEFLFFTLYFFGTMFGPKKV